MRLFHISEQADITRFVPRPSPNAQVQLDQPAVWAIAEETLWMYLVPRDCPRVAYRNSANASAEDIASFLHGDPDKRVLTIESAWFERCCSTTLYCYELSDQHFSLYDQHALYYLAHTTIEPLSVTVIDHPLQALMQRGIDLHVLAQIWDIRELIIQSSLNWSIIRMRNATAPPRGYAAYHPL